MKKILLEICGLLFVALAFLGVFIPGLPTTPFLIVAAGCFAKSSPRLHQWLLRSKIFGPIIRNWQETRTIPRRAKWASLIVIGLVVMVSLLAISNLWLKVLVFLMIIFPAIFILRLDETESIS